MSLLFFDGKKQKQQKTENSYEAKYKYKGSLQQLTGDD